MFTSVAKGIYMEKMSDDTKSTNFNTVRTILTFTQQIVDGIRAGKEPDEADIVNVSNQLDTAIRTLALLRQDAGLDHIVD